MKLPKGYHIAVNQIKVRKKKTPTKKPKQTSMHILHKAVVCSILPRKKWI